VREINLILVTIASSYVNLMLLIGN